MVLSACLVLAFTVAPARAITLGAGVSAFGLAKPSGGDMSGDALTDVELSVSFVPGLSLGGVYSRFTTNGGENWYDTDTEIDHEEIGGFLLVEFLPTSAITPYARIGAGSVTSQVSDHTEWFTTGAFAGFGGRAYLKTYASVSLELQYQHLDVGDESGLDDFDRAQVWRVVVGVQGWWAPGQ